MKPHQEAVAEVLGYSKDEYAHLIYERGLEWLNYYHKGHRAAIELFAHSAHFWSAWKDQFAQTDADLFDGLRVNTVAMLLDSRCHESHRLEFMDAWTSAHKIEAVRECPDRASLRLMSEELRDEIATKHYDDNR
jgi:hypothetical protein